METSWDESRTGPNGSGLNEAAAQRESGEGDQEREGELERRNNCVYRRMTNEHQLHLLLFLSDFDSVVAWP